MRHVVPQPDLLDDRSFALVAECGQDGERISREREAARQAKADAEAAQGSLFDL